MRRNRSKRNVESPPTLQIFAVVAGLLVSLWINFHWYLPDFNLVPGDRGDTRLVVFTLEHWFRALQGLDPFFRLQMFYPDPNALAYADGLFLFAVPYTAFRLAGLNYFSSYQLLLVLLTGIGYVAWVQLLRGAVRTTTALAALGGSLLTSLNALQLQADIGKLSAIHFFPVLLLWLWAYVAAKDRRDSKALLGLAGFAAGLGLLFFTSYYPAWLLLFTLIVVAVLAAASGALVGGARKTLERGWGYLARQWWHVMLAAAVFLLALIPFIITYAPLIAAGSNRSYDLVLEFSPRLRDVLNVSANNVVWSPLWKALGLEFGNREVQMGTPMLVLSIAGLELIALIRRLRAAGWLGLSTRDRGLLLIAVTAAVLVMLSVKIGGFSLWYFIYMTVPGASALRAIGRVLMIVDMIVILLAVCGLQELWEARGRQARTRLPIMLVVLSGLLLAEQVNWTPFRLDKNEQLTQLDRYAAPKQNCAAFYVNNASPDGLPFGYYQLDAMMISMKLGIPTANGYSGFEPHEAFTLTPKGAEYRYEMLDWLKSQRAVERICELNLDDGAFRVVEVEHEFAQAQRSFRMELLEDFSALYAGITRFVRDGNSISDLYPQFLEEHGYLDREFGYQTGTRYRWIRDRFWIGEKACGNRECFGMAVVGKFGDLQLILDLHGPQARAIHFPSPQALKAGSVPAQDSRGELLLIFPTSGQAE